MTKQVKIQSGKSLTKILERIVQESLEVAEEERRRQAQLSEEEDDLFGDAGGDDTEKLKTSKTMSDEKEKLASGDVDVEDIISKLNSIRGGRSFKEEPVASKMDEYVKSLTKAERTALFAFLKGLSQIVTGEVEAPEATDPSDDPASVKMKKGSESEAKGESQSIKVTVKQPSKEKSSKPPSTEDTSGPVPISPKKVK